MNLLHLEYFREVAVSEHVQKTGEKLHVSPSSISAAIRSLEQELGVKLFDRSGRNMRLNECGKVFLPYVDKVFATLQDGMAAVQTAQGHQQNIVSFSIKDGALWNDFLLSFITEHPDIHIRQLNQDLDRQGKLLEQANLDFAITDLDLENNALDHCVLFEDTFVVVVSKDHPMAQHTEEPISISKFQNDLFLFRPKTDVFQQYVDRVLEEIGFRPHKTMIMEYMLRYYVFNQGPGIIITTKRTMENAESLFADGVCLQIKEFADFPFSKKMYWRKSPALSPSSLCFKECLQNYVKNSG